MKTRASSDQPMLGRVVTKPASERVQHWLAGLLRSFGYALEGIGAMLRTQRNAQIHVFVTIIVVAAGVWWRITPAEWIACALAWGLVFGMEAMNTALEAVVDLAAPDYHPLAKRAKDAAAGGVLLSALAAVIVGFVIFWPHVWALVVALAS